MEVHQVSIEFVDELPLKARLKKRNQSRFSDLEGELRENPGKWAVIERNFKTKNHGFQLYCKRWKLGKYFEFAFEKDSGSYTVYARFKGEDKS